MTAHNKSWLAKAAVLLLAFFILCATAGYLFEATVKRRNARRFPLQGGLVDVGGYRFHLDCRGAGSPTVVLDSGFVDSSWQWRDIQPAVAELTRVCSYDRAGLGWSDPSPHPRISKWMAQELHTVLVTAAIGGPLVLVGHSDGGLNVLMFAGQYPTEVAGLVLVDGTNPKDVPPTSPTNWHRTLLMPIYKMTASFGIPRLLGHCSDGPADCRQFLGVVEAMQAGRGESARKVRALGNLGNLPLSVIAHDPQHYFQFDDSVERHQREEAWSRSQQELLRLSTRATFLIAKDAGHSIPKWNPQFVIDVINGMITWIRTTKH